MVFPDALHTSFSAHKYLWFPSSICLLPEANVYTQQRGERMYQKYVRSIMLPGFDKEWAMLDESSKRPVCRCTGRGWEPMGEEGRVLGDTHELTILISESPEPATPGLHTQASPCSNQ